MLILLPPSEGKSSPESGPAIDLAGLSFPTLTRARRSVLDHLVRLCRGDLDVAAAALGLGVTQRGEVGANARVKREPCGPAIEVYTGVLYEALDAASLRGRSRARLSEHVVIASALWGLVSPDDLIPSYRLSGGVSLPGIGPLANAWREPVGAVLSATDGLVVDMRSAAYGNLAPLPPDTVERATTVRVLTERNGRRSVVSHNNKATKGHIVRALMTSRRTPKDPDQLADVVASAGFRVEQASTRAGRISCLDVIVD